MALRCCRIVFNPLLFDDLIAWKEFLEVMELRVGGGSSPSLGFDTRVCFFIWVAF